MGKELTKSNIPSERSVLSGIIQHGRECLLEVDLYVDEESFTLEQNKVLFKCARHSLNERESTSLTDILSSARTLGLDQIVERDEVLRHLNGLINTPIRLESVEHHAKILKRLQFARTLQQSLRGIYTELENSVTGEETIASILSMVESPIQDICMSFMREDDFSPRSIGDGILEYIEHVRQNKGKSIGIPTGYAAFDQSIGGGLRRKCVDLIAARPKTGKSVLADNVALNITTQYGIPVLMLDTEMSTEDHWNRIIANLSGIEINSVASGSFFSNQSSVDSVNEAVEKMSSIPYDYVSIAGRPFDETLSIMKRWLLKKVGYDENGRLNDCVIIYDYLKLMTSSSISSNLAEFQVLGFQITALHNFCVENDCPCLSFVQLNRDGITKETTDVVSGSDRLVWLCTSFSIFKNKTEEEIMSDGINNGNKKLIPVVSRHGPGIGDDGYICLNMDGSVARIEELGTIRELNRNAARGFPESEDSRPASQNDETLF
jgi:replicative DNA helicase